MNIQIKRAYEAPHPSDGERYLVDRLWPRGVKRESLEITGWLKDAAPSDALRRWFNHDPERWDAFRQRYFAELDENPDSLEPLRESAQRGTVTLVYSAREKRYNQAAALKEYLEKPA